MFSYICKNLHIVMMLFYLQVMVSCKPNKCVQECISVIKEFRNDPCVRGQARAISKLGLLYGHFGHTLGIAKEKIKLFIKKFESCDLVIEKF